MHPIKGVRLILCGLTIVLLLSGCYASSKSRTHYVGQTLGKELLDLKAAYDDRLLSDEEYQRARERLIESGRDS